MANPAALLHDLLTSWYRNGTAAELRGISDVNSEGWTQVRLALRHIDAIAESLAAQDAQGRRVSAYVAAVPRWTAAALAYPGSWDTDSTSAINTADVALLDTLAGAMDTWVTPTDEGQRESILDFCTSITDLVASDESLPEELRLHLASMILHVRDCLERFAISGDFELRVALDRLIMAVGLAYQQSADPSKWKTAAESFIYPFAVAVTSSPLTALLGQLALGN